MGNAACVWMASNDVALEMQARIVLAHAQGACGHHMVACQPHTGIFVFLLLFSCALRGGLTW